MATLDGYGGTKSGVGLRCMNSEYVVATEADWVGGALGTSDASDAACAHRGLGGLLSSTSSRSDRNANSLPMHHSVSDRRPHAPPLDGTCVSLRGGLAVGGASLA